MLIHPVACLECKRCRGERLMLVNYMGSTNLFEVVCSDTGLVLAIGEFDECAEYAERIKVMLRAIGLKLASYEQLAVATS